ncbi:MAG TPA: response regulator [Gemmatimonadales bacterium]|nr:response regulator [Gemmatimonadales bacterium]
MAPDRTVLIVEDDPVTSDLLAVFLRTRRYRVLTAVDAMQGLTLAHREQPDVVLLDIGMPAGGGLSCWDRMARSDRTRHIPVIIMTANPRPELAEQARARGAAGFFAKPVDLDALAEHLARVLVAAGST